MKDEIQIVQCPDCKRLVQYSFGILASDGKEIALMLVAGCRTCQKNGDRRSLRNFVDIGTLSVAFAMANELPLAMV